MELALRWIAVTCILIKSPILNHTSTAQETATSCPDDDENRTDMVRINAVELKWQLT